MKLEHLEVELRPRTAHEGVELGLAMLRRWRAPVARAWMATFAPVALALGWALREWPLVWLIALWWLKPLFERTVVFVLSRAMFGAAPRVGDVLQQWRSIWWSGLFRTLTWRRIATTRALAQPVEMLEGLSGAARRRRERDVGLGAFGLTLGVGLVGWLFERVLELGLLLLVVFATPSELLPATDALTDGRWSDFRAEWLAYAAAVAHLLAYSVGASLHAASGFGLYLQRRTELEGWDLEVAFRRLGARVQLERGGARGASRGARIALLLVLSGIGSVLPTRVSQAAPQTSDVESVGPAAALAQDEGSALDAPEAIRRVLARPEFETAERDTRWVLDLDIFRRLDRSKPDPRGLAWVVEIVRALAWVLCGVALVALVYSIVRRLKRSSGPPPAPPRTPPTHVFGLDVRPESLPPDVPATALALWRSGEARAALSLLYRASLASLISADGVELDTSDTEHDCLRRARRELAAPRAEFFARVTEVWLRCAYARSLPADPVVEELCGAWSAHFLRQVRA